MSKIICDICGTTYPDTADCCPICGCSKDSAMDFLGDEFKTEEAAEDTRAKKGKFSSKKRKEIFDYDEVNPQLDATETLEEEIPDDEEDVYEDRPQSNTFAVIALTVLIAGLLLAAGFLCIRYILPNLHSEEPVVTEPAPPAAFTQPTESTGYVIPCQNIALVSGPAYLTQEGQYHLINVAPVPEDTTDKITYASADESIATVDENGKITAVSEGETIVYVTCGNAQVPCPVVVKYEEETVPTEAETEPVEVETEPEIDETEAPTEAPVRTDVTLKLKKTDIKLGVYYEYRLELDCDLKPEDVEWSVEHSHIVSVDDTGLIKALKSGVTDVIVKYGDQEVRCKVRCE